MTQTILAQDGRRYEIAQLHSSVFIHASCLERQGADSSVSESKSYESPEGYYYTKDHEWIKITGSTVLVGITDYAAKMLNDIVYVNLPQPGAIQKKKDVFGQVESVKTVSDMYMPLSGKVLKINSNLAQTPELVSNSPYSEGWMMEVEPSDLEREKKELLDSRAYKEYIETLKE